MSRARIAVLLTVAALCLSVSTALAQSVTFMPAVFMGRTPTATVTSTPLPTATATLVPAPLPTATARPAVCACGGNYYNCSDFSSWAAAQACYQYCLSVVGYDVHRLDADSDGIACESLR